MKERMIKLYDERECLTRRTRDQKRYQLIFYLQGVSAGTFLNFYSGVVFNVH